MTNQEKKNIYNAIQNLYNMDFKTWQEVISMLYNLVADVNQKFDTFESKFEINLGSEVTSEIKKLHDNGTLSEIINDELLSGINATVNDINNKVIEFKDDIHDELDKIENNKVNNIEFNKLQEKMYTFESRQIEGLNQAEVLALTSIATDNNGTTFPTPNARIEAIQTNAYDNFSTSPLLYGYTYKIPLTWKKGINVAGVITNNYAGYFYSNIVSIEGDFHIELRQDYLIRVLKYVNGVYKSQTDYNGYKSIDIIKEPNTSYSFMVGKTVRDINLSLVTAINNFGIYAKKIDIEKSVPNLKNDTLLLCGYATLGEIKTNWKLGAINGNGIESAYGKSIISDFFQIVDGISLVYDDSIYTCLLHEFNNAHTWVKSVTLNNDGFTKYYPKNSSNYYKVVFFKTVLENVTDVTKLSQSLKLFRGYSPSFKYLKSEIDGIKKRNSQGKTWNRVGDSITQQDRYTSYVVNNTGVIASKNMGLASSTIAINNSYMQNKSFVERVCGLNGNTAYDDADIWSIFGGINDYYLNSPIGDINSIDNTTVYGALKQICENILNRSNYPKLILLTPLQSFYNTKPNKLGKYPIDYVKVVKDVAKYYSIPCVDLYSRGGLNAMNVQRANNPTTTDGLHPNDYGTKLWVGEFILELNNLTYY